MRTPHVDDHVRLLAGVPETGLCPGQVGVVCSQWDWRDEPFYEVEFPSADGSAVTRRVVRGALIAVDGEEEPKRDVV